MDAILVFGEGNDHPLAWILNRRHRHVFAAVCDAERGFWLSYDWFQGIPIIRAECASTYDLAGYYRQLGYDVAEVTVGDRPAHGPLMPNNCVGHAMVVCGIRKRGIFTPHQLWRHVTKAPSRARRLLAAFEYVPGFSTSNERVAQLHPGVATLNQSLPPPPEEPAPPVYEQHPSQTILNQRAKERRLAREAELGELDEADNEMLLS